MFLVISCNEHGLYTPIKMNTYEEAYEWMVKRTADRIRDEYENEFDADSEKSIFEMTDEEVFQWAKENRVNFAITETSSYLYYGYGGFKETKIFDLDKI